MAYGLIIDNILVQKQPYPQEGFVEISDSAVCGQIWDGGNFINPEPTEPQPPEYPTEFTVQDVGTGEPVKIIIKNGQIFLGGLDDEPPSE